MLTDSIMWRGNQAIFEYLTFFPLTPDSAEEDEAERSG